MTREDIICMAQEAGLVGKPIFTEGLEHFATLVASAERERIAKKLEQLPFGDTAASFSIYVRES